MVALGAVEAWVAAHEGFRATAYYDSRGFLTIGYGTNMDAAGAAGHCAAAGLDYNALRNGGTISEPQALALMSAAAQHAMDVACVMVKGFLAMPEKVQLAIVDMIYNMGATRFAEFVHAIAAFQASNWKLAAAEMVNSLWYRQVGVRGKDDVGLVLSAA